MTIVKKPLGLSFARVEGLRSWLIGEPIDGFVGGEA